MTDGWVLLLIHRLVTKMDGVLVAFVSLSLRV